MKAFCFAFLYFLFDRSLQYTLHNDALQNIFALLSQLASVIVVGLFFLKSRKVKHFKPFAAVLLIWVSLLGSTIKGGDLYSFVAMAYPSIAMVALLGVILRTEDNSKIFVKSVSWLYFALVVINFLLLIVSPGLFDSNCFLGLENQVGYPLLTGFMFVLVNNHYNENLISRSLLVIYVLAYICTIFFIFSGSNIIGLIVVLLAVTNNPFNFLLRRISFNKIMIFSLVIFVFSFIFDGLILILENNYVVYIIEELLGKDTTLTGRVEIWVNVLDEVFDSPIIGYGIQDDFDRWVGFDGNLYSAHNQMLQMLWSGGIMFYVCFIPLILLVNSKLKKQDESIANIFKSIVLAEIVMYMAEAPGMHILTPIAFATSLSVFDRDDIEDDYGEIELDFVK